MQQETFEASTGKENVEIQLGSLKPSERAVLAELISRLAPGADRLVVATSEIAQALGLSPRTVQISYARLIDLGIVQRVPVDPANSFSKVATVFSRPGLADQLRGELDALRGGRPRRMTERKARKRCDPTVSTATFPYRSLRCPSRFKDVPALLNKELAEGKTYWSWLAAALDTLTMKLPLALEAQTRRMRDGERGGVIRPMHRIVGGVNVVAPVLDDYARLCHRTGREGTFRVALDAHPILLVDDVKLERLQLLPESAALLETSPGNFQATLIAPRALSKQERLYAQRGLIDMVAGDPAANNASQLRRFPGSINNKPALAAAFVTRVHRIPAALTLSTQEIEALIQRGREAYMPPEHRAVTAPTGVSTDASRAESHAGLPNGRDLSPSGMDFRFAMRRIAAGESDRSIVEAVAVRAGERRKRGVRPGAALHREYAELTVNKARAVLQRNKPLRRAAHRPTGPYAVQALRDKGRASPAANAEGTLESITPRAPLKLPAPRAAKASSR